MIDHQPVLVAEVLEGLALVPDGWYVDATYGRGGHSTAILQRLGPAGRLFALDKDPEAVVHARSLAEADKRLTVVHGDFARLGDHVSGWLDEHELSGLLLDLGVSSPQLDDPGRGFSFSGEGPLDMRMNHSTGPTLAEWLADVDRDELASVIKRYGEQPGAHRIASAIVRARRATPLRTTRQLAEIVAASAPRTTRGRTHPATRVFQALRIALNDELVALERALEQGTALLAAGGRLVVISFHSLEDRIVKRFVARQARGDPAYAGLPEMPAEARPTLRPVGGLVRPTSAEIERNPRARSSRLRVAEKLAMTGRGER
jgi:16S rRNA (cytosine1402-N4)-methyltransferase